MPTVLGKQKVLEPISEELEALPAKAEGERGHGRKHRVGGTVANAHGRLDLYAMNAREEAREDLVYRQLWEEVGVAFGLESEMDRKREWQNLCLRFEGRLNRADC